MDKLSSKSINKDISRKSDKCKKSKNITDTPKIKSYSKEIFKNTTIVKNLYDNKKYNFTLKNINCNSVEEKYNLYIICNQNHICDVNLKSSENIRDLNLSYQDTSNSVARELCSPANLDNNASKKVDSIYKGKEINEVCQRRKTSNVYYSNAINRQQVVTDIKETEINESARFTSRNSIIRECSSSGRDDILQGISSIAATHLQETPIKNSTFLEVPHRVDIGSRDTRPRESQYKYFKDLNISEDPLDFELKSNSEENVSKHIKIVNTELCVNSLQENEVCPIKTEFRVDGVDNEDKKDIFKTSHSTSWLGAKKTEVSTKLHNLVEKTSINELKRESVKFFTYLDEKKKLHKCHTIMIDFKSKQKLKGYNCYWCRHNIPSYILPIGCPIRYVHSNITKKYKSELSKDKYMIREDICSNDKIYKDNIIKDNKDYYLTDGIFCSFGCAKSYIKDNIHDSLYNNSSNLLIRLYNDINNININNFNDDFKITEAPHWRLLKNYGGHLSINDFRKGLNSISWNIKGYSEPSFTGLKHLYEKKVVF